MDDISPIEKEYIENKIIDWIASAAGSRLVVSKPEHLDKDLIVEKKGGYKKVKISLNVYRKEQLLEKKEINPEENFYLMFVDFDIVKQDIGDEIFVVSAFDSKKLTMNKKDFVSFLISEFEKQ